jgi:alpha 1,2-mannosyltransferase
MHQTERESLRLPYKRDTRGIVSTAGGSYLVVLVIFTAHAAEGLVQHCPFEVFLANIEEYETHICNVVLPLSERQVCRAVPNIGCCPLQSSKSAATSIRFSRYSSRSFEEVLFLDSDAFPVHDPDILFDSEPFNSTGLVLWPDFWYASESPAYFAISSQKCPL